MTPGIICPTCRSAQVSVYDSRPGVSRRRRRYKCAAGHRFTTVEFAVHADQPMLVKLTGTGVQIMSAETWIGKRVNRVIETLRKSFVEGA